jgi:hypothetical protein
MTHEPLDDLLERAGDDGRVAAEARAWPVAREAFSQRPPADLRRSRPPVAALAAAGVAIVIALLAASSPGAAVAHWLRDQIVGRPGVHHSAPALTHLPGGGRLLISAPQGVWVVNPDGSRRLLAGYAGATWSPRGLYIGVWRGRQLFAVEPGGRVHWSLARSHPIRAADWSPDGFRVAYLSGRTLRVVAGDGTGDVRLRARVAAVAPAWRPDAPHLLALGSRPKTVDVVATDVDGLVWRARLPQAVRRLSWSADGRLLAVVQRTRVTVLGGASGRVRTTLTAPAGMTVGAAAFAHNGARVALVFRSATRPSRAATVDLSAPGTPRRGLFTGTGRFSQVNWSPDDRWILISWPPADQWLFLRSTRVSAVSAVGNIAAQFDPGKRRARFPAISGWCCG